MDYPTDPQHRIIVALDVDSREEALNLVNQLRGKVGLFKVGSQLFSAEGPSVVQEILKLGEHVFLDLKFHDIPNTAVKSALAAQRMGVSMLTLHTSGGLKMMENVMASLKDTAAEAKRPLVLGVTVLTSMREEDLKEIGLEVTVSDQVVRLATLAKRAGLDGIVAAPVEVPLLRQHLGNSLKLVTPGIRPAGSALNDQNRITTPAAALEAGADFLVIGRPITASRDPLKSLDEILESMRM